MECRRMLVLIVGVVLLGGCGREADVSEEPRGAEPVTVEDGPGSVEVKPEAVAADPVRSAPGIPERAPLASGPRLLKESEVPFRVCAVTWARDGGVSVGVADKQSRRSSVLQPGHAFGTYTLVSYDSEVDAAVFLYAGEQVMIRPSSGPAENIEVTPPDVAASDEMLISLTVQPAETRGLAPDKIDLATVKPPHFEPTAREKELGIDPQNASTWPDGYRGPAIERMIQKQREAGIEPDVRLVHPALKP
jgi:hypothetical protein